MTAPTWTPEDAAARYGISRATVLKMCRTGKWPHVHVGRSVRFTDEQLAQIDQIQTVEPRADVTTANTWGRKTRRAS